jgi:hypothetical protein
MAKTSKSCWKNFERECAKDWKSFRMPLSGQNSRHGGGDVLIPDDVDVLVECKLRAKHAHHALFSAAEADALKHGKKHAILYTKQKHKHGCLVVLDGELWSELLTIDGVMGSLKK